MSDLPAIPPPDAPKEPMTVTGIVTAVVSAALALAVTLGLHLTADQTTAILAVVAVLAPVVVALIGRSKVFAPATVRAMIIEARKVNEPNP